MKNSLPDHRKERGLSQQALADALGVSRQTVISLEKGRYDPRCRWRLSSVRSLGAK